MNALLWHARGWPAGHRPSLVGRLDKLTSGIVIVAKTAAIHAALQRTMASSGSEKDYLAVVYGRVNAARGDIDLRLARDRRRSAAGRRVGDRRRAEPDASSSGWRVCAAPRAGLSLLRCRLGPAARTRSASIWRRAAGRWSAIRSTASRAGQGSLIRRSPRCSARFRARPFTRGGWVSSPRQRCASVD